MAPPRLRSHLSLRRIGRSVQRSGGPRYFVNEIGIPFGCSGPRWRLARGQPEVAPRSAARNKPYLVRTVSTSPPARILRRDQAMTTAPGVPARARERPVAHIRIAVPVEVLSLSFTVACFIGNSLVHSISSG